jgi:hypothetical protein
MNIPYKEKCKAKPRHRESPDTMKYWRGKRGSSANAEEPAMPVYRLAFTPIVK